MSFAGAPIFISYSRSDGREFAEAFERRLAAEGIHTWRDLKESSVNNAEVPALQCVLLKID